MLGRVGFVNAKTAKGDLVCEIITYTYKSDFSTSHDLISNLEGGFWGY